MYRYIREVPGASCTVVRIDRPTSNFSFIDEQFPSFPFVAPLRRIFSQVRNHNGKTAVIEELDPTSAVDLVQENEDLGKRFEAPVSSQVRRLSFFSQLFSSEEDLAALENDCFIGYAIIKEDVAGEYQKSRVYESVIHQSRHPNNFIRGSQDWRCCVGRYTFSARGYLYAQQNSATNVCAHVACRTAAAKFHPDGDMTYREMNDLLGIDHIHTRIDKGLSSSQMRKILEASGARCTVGAYPTKAPDVEGPPFQKMIYGSIESGYPVLVCFAVEGGAHHAVPMFGHTFNEDMWVPHAERFYFRIGERTTYIPSESWLSNYVCHDDNWGTNYCIPRHFLYTKQFCRKWPEPEGPKPCEMELDCVAYVLATLPAEAKVGPIQAEAIGMDYLSSMLRELPDPSEPWKNRLAEYAAHRMLVLRPLLVQSSQYLDHLARVVDWDSDSIRSEMIDTLRAWPGLPKGMIWMVELSVPELFSANRRKVGEILIRADREPELERDFGNYLLARVPGFFVIHVGGPGEPKYSFIESGAQGHVPLFGCESDDSQSRRLETV